jgi:hypothetical protein
MRRGSPTSRSIAARRSQPRISNRKWPVSIKGYGLHIIGVCRVLGTVFHFARNLCPRSVVMVKGTVEPLGVAAMYYKTNSVSMGSEERNRVQLNVRYLPAAGALVESKCNKGPGRPEFGFPYAVGPSLAPSKR